MRLSNVADRFKSYGWQVLRVEDGNDVKAISEPIAAAKANEDQPTLIEVKTVIGYGSPNKGGTSASHGAPLGQEEVKLVKAHYGWNYEETFYIPEEVREHFTALKHAAQEKEASWNALFADYETAYPELANQLKQSIDGKLPESWDEEVPVYRVGEHKRQRDPTHEPIEQLASLRSMPGLSVIRPADGNETAAAWKLALSSIDEPTALVLTRQDLPTLVSAGIAYEGVKRGAYIISEAKQAASAYCLPPVLKSPLP